MCIRFAFNREREGRQLHGETNLWTWPQLLWTWQCIEISNPSFLYCQLLYLCEIICFTYCLLQHPISISSEISNLVAEVSNNHLRTLEDRSFKHMIRTQYEKTLSKCEDDQYISCLPFSLGCHYFSMILDILPSFSN